MSVANQVIMDPAFKDGSWAVCFEGRIVESGFNSKGAAEAQLSLYVSGYRKPREIEDEPESEAEAHAGDWQEGDGTPEHRYGGGR